MKEHILLGIRSCLNKTSPYHHLHKIFSLLLSFSERDDGGWDGWMASSTQWTWVWVNSGSWWCTGRPGVLLFMGSQRVRHDRRLNNNTTRGFKEWCFSWVPLVMLAYCHISEVNPWSQLPCALKVHCECREQVRVAIKTRSSEIRLTQFEFWPSQLCGLGEFFQVSNRVWTTLETSLEVQQLRL